MRRSCACAGVGNVITTGMLVIIVLAIIASIALGTEARKKGYALVKPIAYPLIIGFLIIGLSATLLFVTQRFTSPESPMGGILNLVVNVCALALYFTIVAKLWKQFKALPNMKERDVSKD